MTALDLQDFHVFCSALMTYFAHVCEIYHNIVKFLYVKPETHKIFIVQSMRLWHILLHV